MDDKLIDRIFSELDVHSKRLVDLSEVVHANAAILGLVTKLVVGIILFIVVTSIGVLYNHLKSPPLYNRQIAPIENDISTYGLKSGGPANDKGDNKNAN